MGGVSDGFSNLLVRLFFQSVRVSTLKVFGREHHLVLVVITIDLVVDTPGQGIWLGRVLAGSVGERVVKLRQVEGPMGLVTIQGLGCLKVCEILVVVQNLDHVLHSFKDVSPLLESAYDRQHFFVIDCVVPLGRV